MLPVGEGEFIPFNMEEPDMLPKPDMDIGPMLCILCRPPKPAGPSCRLVPPICGIWAIPVQRVSGKVHKSFMPPNGESPVEGRRAPGVRNTLVVFLRFFHLARRFWNQTCNNTKRQI